MCCARDRLDEEGWSGGWMDHVTGGVSPTLVAKAVSSQSGEERAWPLD